MIQINNQENKQNNANFNCSFNNNVNSKTLNDKYSAAISNEVFSLKMAILGNATSISLK